MYTIIPRVPQCLSSRPNWDSPIPSPASEYAGPKGERGGTHSPAFEGVRNSQLGRLEKMLSTLPTLWFLYPLSVDFSTDPLPYLTSDV